MRSAIAVCTVLIVLNVNLKKKVYDGITRKNVGPLIFRTTQGTISNFINYSVTRYIPSSIVSVINQIGPIACMVLAAFILKETVLCFDIVIMGVNFGAILVTILGTSKNPTNDDDTAL